MTDPKTICLCICPFMICPSVRPPSWAGPDLTGAIFFICFIFIHTSCAMFCFILIHALSLDQDFFDAFIREQPPDVSHRRPYWRKSAKSRWRMAASAKSAKICWRMAHDQKSRWRMAASATKKTQRTSKSCWKIAASEVLAREGATRAHDHGKTKKTHSLEARTNPWKALAF